VTDNTDEVKLRTGLPQKAFADADKQIRERTDRLRQVYANNMRVSFSTWDCGITFGEIVGERDGEPIIEETVKVLITREIAKVLAIILKSHIDVFESRYGEIKVPVSSDDTSAATAESESKK